MPKILLEHQLPSNAAPYRRRHSSNSYLGFSPQKRQRMAAVVAGTLCLLFFLTFSSRSGAAAGRGGYDGAAVGYRTPVRAQSMLLFAGLKPLPHVVDQAGEYDAAGHAEKEAAVKLTGGDAIMTEEEEELSIEQQEALYFRPPGASPPVQAPVRRSRD